jgi:DNA repair exonuclease SbcCD nuclease subunit
MIKFLHTSDWQLGMTRHFLAEDAQERFTQARFDSIRNIVQIAKEEKCSFMLVCGDTFESNQVDRKTIARAIEALKDIQIPVYILPGNHDPLNAASVYRSSTFIDRKPGHVHVIESSVPIKIDEGFELVGAPWMSKRPAINPIEEVIANLTPTIEIIRICMGHGNVDLFTPDRDAPGVIATATLEKAIEECKIQCITLGDRHSLTSIGSSERIWYSGTPESTDFSETQSGYVQVIEISEDRVTAKAVKVGNWKFIKKDRVDLNTADDIEALHKYLEGIDRKDLTIVRMNLVGCISLSLTDMLQKYLITYRDVFGAFDIQEDELIVIADESDFIDLGFSGFANTTVERLRERMSEKGEESITARDALMLLLRLARGMT